jgi:hypothetical protein
MFIDTKYINLINSYIHNKYNTKIKTTTYILIFIKNTEKTKTKIKIVDKFH